MGETGSYINDDRWDV